MKNNLKEKKIFRGLEAPKRICQSLKKEVSEEKKKGVYKLEWSVCTRRTQLYLMVEICVEFTT